MDTISAILGWGLTLVLYNVIWAFFITGLFTLVIGKYLKRERANERAKKT
ncbi:MAG: hypothetical protein HY893_06200 [Deltaproteobacteria bacterium]|nr:hypothetical protein [Deltaproteobacteria bacterium]